MLKWPYLSQKFIMNPVIYQILKLLSRPVVCVNFQGLKTNTVFPVSGFNQGHSRINMWTNEHVTENEHVKTNMWKHTRLNLVLEWLLGITQLYCVHSCSVCTHSCLSRSIRSRNGSERHFLLWPARQPLTGKSYRSTSWYMYSALKKVPKHRFPL